MKKLKEKETTKNKSSDNVFFWDSGSKSIKIGLATLVTLFGAIMLINTLFRLPHATSDEYAMLVFSIVLCIIGRFMFRYFLNPRIKITAGRLFYYGFWRVQTWALADIAGVATKKEKLKRKRGAPTAPLVIEWIVLELKDGRTGRFIGPNFTYNAQLLNILAERLNIEIDHDDRPYKEIPEGVSPFGRRFF